MAKEMMIVFVYDPIRCLSESDDPADAVLYFHPSWVSDGQRVALCGQLMGVTHCLKALFSTPNMLTLQSGKFLIKEYGRYILAIGSDRNIPDWMLKNRADILTSLIKVYHCDLQTVAANFPGENNPRFSEKLYQMFETYLPILQFGGYMFQSVPMLDLPKSATNIFLECMQLLENCQKTDGVLGGTILYNNKIVATQINNKITSHLAMVDPYRIKSPAETLQVDHELPSGVQLIVVYIKKKYVEILKKDAERIRVWQQNGFEKIKTNKSSPAKTNNQNEGYTGGGMKRDISLLFTAVPEEDISNITPSPKDGNSPSQSRPKSVPKTAHMPDVVPFNSKPRVRPNKLSLSFKNTVSIPIDEHQESKCTKIESVYTGQTSVCTTPMLEYKRLHPNVLSICKNPEESTFALDSPHMSQENPTSLTRENIIESPKRIPEKANDNNRTENKAKVLADTNTEKFINKPLLTMKKFKSLTDINGPFKRISHLAMMRLGKVGNKNLSLNSDLSDDEDDNSKRISMTITDPCYPVFRNDGLPISKDLFDYYLSQHYIEIKEDAEELKEPQQVNKIQHLEGFDCNLAIKSPARRKSHDSTSNIQIKKELSALQSDKNRRKSLCLPLKPLGVEKIDIKERIDSVPVYEGAPRNKKLTGVQLTPLMEKLSHLAFSEKSSGYSSRGVTPMDFKDFSVTTPSIEKPLLQNSNNKIIKPDYSESDSESDDENSIVGISSFSVECTKCILYVYGYQNTAVMVLVEEPFARRKDTVEAIWEGCEQKLKNIDQLCGEPIPTGNQSSETYSFLTLDPQWGPIKKGGPWASSDIATMGYIHKDFKADESLTEIIIRGEDSLVYATSCGGSETYYQESGAKMAGLPTPADLMATAPLKAKRRLHRDHSITIF